MVRLFFRLAIRDHFFGPLGCLLESFWGVLSLVLSHLGLFWARFWALRAAFWNPLTLYAHQLINASTLQPVARQHFETRAGGLRAERLNKDSGPYISRLHIRPLVQKTGVKTVTSQPESVRPQVSGFNFAAALTVKDYIYDRGSPRLFLSTHA